MRLINVDSYELKHFLDPKRIPHYAILSHTWGEEEVSLQDMELLSRARSRKGFQKIEYCCQQAKKDGYAWAWVDTCCIDKTSSTELSEAINSMFAWYSDSSICYAYLEDVDSIGDLISRSKVLRNSDDWRPPRWFTRGWTLQELIAPIHIEFYSTSWGLLGSLSEYQTAIASLTGINHGILDGSINLDDVSAATKLSWASERSTTRKEDEAYCLLGIFDVNMPLLYGEGEKAFQRLLHEILVNTDDQTIFFWRSPWLAKPPGRLPAGFERPCLARSPRDYRESLGFCRIPSQFDPDMRVASRERGIRITARSMKWTQCKLLNQRFESGGSYSDELWVMGINCTVGSSQISGPGAPESFVVVTIKPFREVGDKVTSWTLCGHWYILVAPQEVESWPLSTHFLQNFVDTMATEGPIAIWKTPTFGYAEHSFLKAVIGHPQHISPGCDELDYAWGLLLDQSNSSPWILITFCLGYDNSDGFCDVWRVPDLIKSKFIELENSQSLFSEHRVDVLCDARFEDLYAGGRRVTWKRRHKNQGLWIKANCCIEKGLSLTVVVTADSNLQMSIQRSHGPLSPLETPDRLNDIWDYIASRALQSLYYEHDEYISLREDW